MSARLASFHPSRQWPRVSRSAGWSSRKPAPAEDFESVMYWVAGAWRAAERPARPLQLPTGALPRAEGRRGWRQELLSALPSLLVDSMTRQHYTAQQSAAPHRTALLWPCVLQA